jgi:uncharacterized protein YjbI with pentapeptide repeats
LPDLRARTVGALRIDSERSKIDFVRTTRRSSADRLRLELANFASGQDRSIAAIERMAHLVARVETIPWRDELLFVTGHYSAGEEATGEDALVALAELVLDDWARKPPEPRWRLIVPSDAKGLHKRWLDEPGRERAQAVARNLSTGRLSNFAFGLHDGRLDLRGFIDPSGRNRGRWIGNLENVDFSGATFHDFALRRKTIDGSRFDGVSFVDFRLWSTTVRETSFRATRFGEIPVLSGVSGWPRRCLFRRVDFRGANLSELDVRRARFEDCDFSGARLNRASFECDLVRCRFAGHLTDVAFWGWHPLSRRRLRIEDVDMSDSTFRYVAFRATDLADFRLPSDSSLRVVPNWPCVYARLADAFTTTSPEDIPLSVRFALINEPKGMPDHGAMVLELGTYREDDTAEGIAQLEGLLAAAEAECAAGLPDVTRNT